MPDINGHFSVGKQTLTLNRPRIFRQPNQTPLAEVQAGLDEKPRITFASLQVI